MHYYISRDLIWFRFGKRERGFSIKRTELMFSERYGYTRFVSLPFGWRLVFLKPFNQEVKDVALLDEVIALLGKTRASDE